MQRSLRSTLGVVSTALFGAALAVWAQPDPVKARHDAMEQMNDAMKELAKVAKREVPFDAGSVRTQASAISERLAAAAKLFPAGSDKGTTHAKAEVWSDRVGFEKALTDAQSAAAGLQAAKDEVAFRAALGALGQSCKACHDKYRMSEHEH